jgi:hypothetical protein
MKNIAKLTAGLLAVAPLFVASQELAAAGMQTREYTPRQQMVYDIVNTWGPHVREAHRADIGDWARQMGPLFKRASLQTLRKAADAPTFERMNSALLAGATNARMPSQAIDASKIAPKILGDADKDLIYVPVTPCRIIDTRVAGGAIAANTTRNFDVTAVANYSFQGGDASNCNVGSSGSFAAAAINFTVVTPSIAGYITAFPYLTSQPLAATVNYTAGDIRGNLAIVKLDQGASAEELSVYTFAQTHLVADIVGYYRNPGVPTLECVNTANTSLVIPAGGVDNVSAPSCLAGYTQTATNCESSTWQMPFVYFNGGTCSAQNNSAANATLRASRTCCRPVFN